MPDTIYVLNGPNLNLLGTREPAIYGSTTLDDIAEMLTLRAEELGLDIDLRQSNHEGHLLDWLHEAQAEGAVAVLLNAGAFTHTSLALYDAIRSIKTPVIEVHISNLGTRDEIHRNSILTPAVRGTVMGLGWRSYTAALRALVEIVREEKAAKR